MPQSRTPSDAGFFLDHNTTAGLPYYTPVYQYVANMQVREEEGGEVVSIRFTERGPAGSLHPLFKL